MPAVRGSLPARAYKVSLPIPHHQNRAGGMAHDAFRGAADEQVGEARAPLRSEDDQVGVVFRRGGDNGMWGGRVIANNCL